MIDDPQFRTVLRGYDPEQVAAAVHDLQSSLGVARRAVADRTIELSRVTEAKAEVEAELAEIRARLTAPGHDPRDAPGAPSRPTGSSEPPETPGPTAPEHRSHGFDQLGTRVASILRLAEAEADQLRSTAADEAQVMRQEAAAAADAIVAEADEHARVAQAELADAIRHRDAVHAHLVEVDQLLAVLDEALADAGHLPHPEPTHG